ncbi:hypothetical protein [Deinococcus apachensis]|uniref:hypothetical protein n=1 Tax=Deinococcus apachensis TaxID=309886 RepID=UPI0003730714|nr:hypothetical protein [Deinococcus apachensis]
MTRSRHLHSGPPRGPREAPLGEVPLTVLVGVTGVGKSTALAALQGADPAARVLPDRRQITDDVMILPLAGKPVADRAERFALTARYRQLHPGGMAHAVGTLTADLDHWGEHPIFDGLRGLEEVEYAATTFPAWRFVALNAPDGVRVRRLLGRADAFDQIEGGDSSDLRAELGRLPGVGEVFTPAELDALAALEVEGYSPADVLAKTAIVVTERQHYDPDAASALLRTLPFGRALVLDTVALGPERVAVAIREWA